MYKNNFYLIFSGLGCYTYINEVKKRKTKNTVNSLIYIFHPFCFGMEKFKATLSTKINY